MKNILLVNLAAAIIVLVAGACRAPSAPTSLPSPTKLPYGATPEPVSTIRAVSPEESAWIKVEEEAKREGMLMVYGANVYASDAGPAVSAAFKKRYGITVEILTGTGRSLNERVKVEQALNKPVADFLQIGLSSGIELATGGFLQPLTVTPPSLKKKDAFVFDPVYDPQRQLVSFAFSTTGPVINTRQVTPQEEPKSWHDFLEPKWKQRILMEDPTTSGGSMSVINMTLFYKILDLNYFEKLKQQQPTIWRGSSPEALKMIARGEYPILFGGAWENAINLIREGAPIKLLPMKEGNAASTVLVALPKKAAHPNAALLFLDWSMSQEGQEVLARARGDKSLRKDVGDFTYEPARFKLEKMFTRTWEAVQQTAEHQKLMRVIFDSR